MTDEISSTIIVNRQGEDMARIRSKVKMQGRVILELTDGERVIRREHRNLVVNRGYEIMAKLALWVHEEPDRMAYIAVGEGGHVPGDVNTPIPPQLTDTQLETETSRTPIYLFESPSTNVIKFRTSVDKDTSNGYVTEAGLFTEGGDMFARVTFPSVYKFSPWYLVVTWEITFSEGATS